MVVSRSSCWWGVLEGEQGLARSVGNSLWAEETHAHSGRRDKALCWENYEQTGWRGLRRVYGGAK